MPGQLLEAQIRDEGGVAIIDLSGEIDGFSEATLQQIYSKAEGLNHKDILLNFTGVHYINSTGIALIVGLLAQARKARRNLITYGLSDHYQEIFNITRLSDFMTIVADEQTALQNVEHA